MGLSSVFFGKPNEDWIMRDMFHHGMVGIFANLAIKTLGIHKKKKTPKFGNSPLANWIWSHLRSFTKLAEWTEGRHMQHPHHPHWHLPPVRQRSALRLGERRQRLFLCSFWKFQEIEKTIKPGDFIISKWSKWHTCLIKSPLRKCTAWMNRLNRPYFVDEGGSPQRVRICWRFF